MNTANSPRTSARRWPSWLTAVLICAISTLATTSCAIGTAATQAPDYASPPPPPPPGLQANQRTPCPPLPPATDDSALALLANHDQVAAIANDCRARNASLLQAVDEWQTTAWRWYCQAVARLGLPAEGCPREAPRPAQGPGPPAR